MASISPRGSARSNGKVKVKKKKSWYKRNCHRECWCDFARNLMYFFIWCVLMLAQAYWLYWLLSEVQRLEADFELYLP